MAVLIEISGEGELAETNDLKRWIEQERISGVDEVRQEFEPPAVGEQGPTALAVISIVLGSAAMVELARSIHVWLTTRKRRLKVKISNVNRVVEVECENPPNTEELLQQIKLLIPDE